MKKLIEKWEAKKDHEEGEARCVYLICIKELKEFYQSKIDRIDEEILNAGLCRNINAGEAFKKMDMFIKGLELAKQILEE